MWAWAQSLPACMGTLPHHGRCWRAPVQWGDTGPPHKPQTRGGYLGKPQLSWDIRVLAAGWDRRDACQMGATLWAQFQAWHLGNPFRELKSHVGPHAPSPSSHRVAGGWQGKHRGVGRCRSVSSTCTRSLSWGCQGTAVGQQHPPASMGHAPSDGHHPAMGHSHSHGAQPQGTHLATGHARSRWAPSQI